MVFRIEIHLHGRTSGCSSQLCVNHADLIGPLCDWWSQEVASGCCHQCSFFSPPLLISFSSPLFANNIIFRLRDSSPQSSSPPLPVQSPSAFTHPFPSLRTFRNLFPPHLLTPPRPGLASAGPQSCLSGIFLASRTETETTHLLCCGFGEKIFVKFLPELAPCAVPSDWSANSPFCWQVTGFCFFLFSSDNEFIISPPWGVQAEAQQIS